MSSIASKTLHAAPEPAVQGWFADLLGAPLPAEGGQVMLRGLPFVMRDGILRAQETLSAAQDQTRDIFGFKWQKRETFDGDTMKFFQPWLVERYGDVARAAWLFATSDTPILLDAGCGAALSALGLFGPVLDRVRYLGVDVSAAVNVARARFAERGLPGAFLQADLNRLPLPDSAVDLIFSEGVLHHTDSTRDALAAVVRHLKKGGRILFYVYRRKGPIREFTDDYIRAQLQEMTPDASWAAMLPLSRLGKVLGDLDVEIEIPEDIALLDIPAGRINLQRFFYWHVLKAFYRPEMSLEEMNHLNFDWYAPKNAHRQSAEDVRSWCAELGLAIEHERVEDAGMTVIARKN